MDDTLIFDWIYLYPAPLWTKIEKAYDFSDLILIEHHLFDWFIL